MTEKEKAPRLTKTVVDGTEPTDRRIIVWDSELPGFGLRVEPKGRKTFVARYRAGGGRAGVLRQSTIGRYGTITVDQARTLAKKLLGGAAGGGDPLGDRRRARQAGLTINEVADWYLKEAEAGRLVGRRGQPIKASTVAMDRSRITTHVKPLIGKRAVSALAAADLERMQADIATGKTAKPFKPKKKDDRRPRGGLPTGGSGVAGRTLRMLQAILEHARRAGMIEVNPAKGSRKMSGSRRARRLSVEEIRTLGGALRLAKQENAAALDAIRFVALTGLRRNEALSAVAGQILTAGGIELTDTKSGHQVRPIGRSAVDLVKPWVTGAKPDAWVFPAERGEGHFVGLPKVLARICESAKLKGVTVHTLRHSFASVAAELGFSELVIAGLLGHRSGSVTSGYVHLDTALVAAADRVSAVISRALRGERTAATVSVAKHPRSRPAS